MKPTVALARAVSALRLLVKQTAASANPDAADGVRSPEVARAHKERQMDLSAIETLMELIENEKQIRR